MNKYLEFISHGLHQIQRTFFPDLEHEAGPISESLIQLTYVLETVYSQKKPLPERCWTGRPLICLIFSCPEKSLRIRSLHSLIHHFRS